MGPDVRALLMPSLVDGLEALSAAGDPRGLVSDRPDLWDLSDKLHMSTFCTFMHLYI